MNGKVCVVTGANSGIGKATATGLAGMGATVVMVCRNRHRGEAAREEIAKISGSDRIELIAADLSLQANVRQLAGDLKAGYPRIDVLVNNAGIAPRRRSLTADGIESVLAVNYLAPFLLTNLLIDRLKTSAPARIVNVAGDYHRRARLNFDDLMMEQDYSGTRANNQAKLALILFTYELARRLEGFQVTANCLHPGAVATGAPLKDPDLPLPMRILYRVMSLFFLSPERGARTSIYLASSPEVEGISGKYFIKRKQADSDVQTHDPELASRLWAVSAELTGLPT